MRKEGTRSETDRTFVRPGSTPGPVCTRLWVPFRDKSPLHTEGSSRVKNLDRLFRVRPSDPEDEARVPEDPTGLRVPRTERGHVVRPESDSTVSIVDGGGIP